MSMHRVLPLPPALSDEALAQRWTARNDPLEDARIMNDGSSPTSVQIHSQVRTPPQQKSSSPPEDYWARSPGQESFEDYGSPLSIRRGPFSQDLQEVRDREEALQDDSPSNICLCQPDPKIPRPRNAFILFRQHHQAKVVSNNPGLANPQISKIIGEQWKNASEDIKTHWKLLAEEEKTRHQKQYPNYRYQPRKANRSGSVSNPFIPVEPGETSPTRCPKCGGRSIGASSMISVSGAPRQLNHRPSQPASSPSRPVTTPLAISSEGGHFMRGMISPPSHPVAAQAYRYVPQRSMGVSSPQSKRGEQFEYAQYSPDPKRRRVVGPLIPVRSPAGPQSPMQFSPHHQRQHSLPRLDSLGLSHRSPGFANPTPKQSSRAPRSDKSLTLAPLRSGLQPRQKETEENSSAKSLAAMIHSIPTLNKVKMLAKISAPYGSSPPGSPAFHRPASKSMGRRGLVIAVEAADQLAMRQLTKTLLNSLSDYDVRVIPTPHFPQGVQPDIQSYLRLIYEHHALSSQVAAHIMSSGVDAVQPQDSPGSSRQIHPLASRDDRSGVNEDDEMDMGADSPVSPKSLPNPLSHRKTTSSGSQPPHNSPSSSSHPHTPSPPASSPFSSRPEHYLQHQHRGASSPPLPDSSPHPSQAFPIVILPGYQLTHTDAFACSVDITDHYSPRDHWQWGATLWRGVVGPDITIAVRKPVLGTGGGEDSPKSLGSGSGSGSGAGSGSGSGSVGRPVAAGTPSANATVPHHHHHHHAGGETAHGAMTGGGGGTAPKNSNNGHAGPAVPGHNANASVGAMTPAAVEVRLEDARAVIVRGESNSNSDNEGSEGGVAEGALRRVGFEVGEWVRGAAERWNV